MSRARVLLVVTLVLALAARLVGLSHGLPRVYHPDEWFYAWNAASILERGDPRLANARGYVNPTGFVYATTIACAALDALDKGGAPGGRGTLARYKARRGDWHLVTRGLSALAGTLAVLLVFRAGVRLERLGAAHPGTAAIAAALLALSPLHVRDAHFGTSDVATSAAVAWTVLALCRHLAAPSRTTAALAGAALGAACAMKYNSGLLVLPAAVTLLLARRRGLADAALAATASLSLFLLFCPAPLVDREAFLASFREQAALSREAYPGQDQVPSWLFHARTLALALGPAGLALALAGLVRLGARPAGLAVSAFPIAHLAVFLPMPFAFARLDVPALPPLALAAGAAAAALLGQLSRLPRGRAAGAVFLAIVLAPPALLSARIDRLLLLRDTRADAEEWLRERVVERPILAADAEAFRGVVPLDGRGEVDRDLPDVLRARLRGAGEVLALERAGVRYVVLTSGGDDETRPGSPEKAFVDALRERADLRFSVDAGRGGEHVPYTSEERYAPFEHAYARARPGPTVRIYELREP